MADAILPRAQAAANGGGPFTREWYDFFRAIQPLTADNTELQAEINAILVRLEALEDAPIDYATINGLASVEVLGSLESGLVQILLEGDTDAPGNTYYYGTGPDGTKGWSTIASAFTEGAGITLTVGADGVTDIAHADTSSVVDISANFTGGTVPDVISITFDAFGHVLTRTISGRTLDHNDTGALQGGNSTERYHLSAAEHTGLLLWAGEDPADYSLITQAITNGDTTHSPSGDAVFDALARTKGYIEGLAMQWVSGTALTVISGAAYIEGEGRIVESTSAIAKTSLSLSASTWYHVYLYLNSGTPDIEIVTTAPVAYSGTARSKTGDTTRRYLGSINTDGSGNIYNFLSVGSEVYYRNVQGTSPFRAVSNASPTTETSASLASVCPVTSRGASIRLINLASSGDVYTGTSDDSASGPPTGGIAAISASTQAFLHHPIDSSQAMTYWYESAPSGSLFFFLDVYGYTYKR